MIAAFAETEQGARLLEKLARRDQLDAEICDAVSDFDAAQLWDLDAATSMIAWLRDRARMTAPQASRLVRTAKGSGRCR